MITFKDFMPEVESSVLGVLNDYESMSKLVERANDWIDQYNIDVINIETLFLNYAPERDDALRGSTQLSKSKGPFLYQAVRVWFRVATPKPEAYTGQTTRL
jgi:Holliday junction resolvasome RuvABC endonuclease subunit